MNRTVLSAFLVVSAVAPLAAQEARQQGNAAATLVSIPAYTDQQRWARANSNAVAIATASIAFAKANGRTPGELAAYFGDRVSPGWGAPNSGVAVRVARAILLNMAGMPNSEAQLVSANDSVAVVRWRRAAYAPLFGSAGTNLRTTVAEYEQFLNGVFGRVSTYLGVHYTAAADSAWVTATVSGRGSAAITAFPRGGTFTATLTAQQAGGADYAGTFTLAFGTDGHFTLADAAGNVRVRGLYDVWLDQMALRDETGPWACPGQPANTYRFTPLADGSVSFGRLIDPCDGRVRFIARNWAKKP